MGLSDATPDAQRRLIDLEAHQEVFAWVIGVLAGLGLVTGTSLGVDATTLVAVTLQPADRGDTK